MTMTNKYMKDGCVAVLYTDNWGSGWSTVSGNNPSCIYHPEVVRWVMNGKSWNEPNWTVLFGEDFHSGGARDLNIAWIPVGTRFYITGFDGQENVIEESDINWTTA
jgi:hypothetical protein